jgi:hypothetical protein
LIGVELFVFGLIAYYVRMISRPRASWTIGGMNLGISAFSALIAIMILFNALPFPLSQNAAMLSLIFAVLVSLSSLAAGLVNLTEEEE